MPFYAMPATSAYGNRDPRVSERLKAWITGAGEAVCGVIGPGTTEDLTANWISPFEGDSLGDKLQKVGGFIQGETGKTSKTTLNSRQVWQGNQPYKFQLELKLYALQDPETEVMQAIRTLKRLASPNANSAVPVFGADGFNVGDTPTVVQLCMRGTMIYKDCVIENLSIPYDKEIGKDGKWIRSTINMQISTIAMLSKSDI
ncbi:hypothetical protein JCM15519_15310 [Fundidesulfovibrio butyratiphilus]